MFERSSYVLSEGAGQKRTDIALVKDASVQTEQEMAVSVIMDLARGTAVLGTEETLRIVCLLVLLTSFLHCFR